MENMTIAPGFKNHTRTGAVRVSFQFTGSGSLQSGVLYVTRNIPEGADIIDQARKAAAVACKRAGAETVKLAAVVNPVR
jgi:hypothetical protein